MELAHLDYDKGERYTKAENKLRIYFENHPGQKLSFNTKMALICAAIKHQIPDFGFVGFYVVAPLLDNDGNPTEKKVLELGAYQSDILASPIIDYGKGVCGDCWKAKEVQIVNDVTTCKNYIACDDVTMSEIVLPVFKSKDDKSEVLAVLDIDSHLKNRFDEKDAEHLQRILDFIYV